MDSLAIGGKWDSLEYKLNPLIISFLTSVLHFESAAPVQTKTIPLLLSNYDVVVEAITGSGKTLAYLIPSFEMILRKENLEVIKANKSAILTAIIVPSRELAQQLYEIIMQFIQFISQKGIEISSACFIGGRDIAADIDLYQKHGANIIVGTPGRLYELLVLSKFSHLFHAGNLCLLVLDEADKLLDLGFKAKLDTLLRRFPKQRRTALFSATQTRELADLARAGMRNPVSIKVRVESIHKAKETGASESKPQVPLALTNYYMISTLEKKLDRTVEFLEKNKSQKILMYTLTCAEVDWLYMALKNILLKSKGFNVFSLHGQMPLKQRQKAHQNVLNSQHCVLVCTDVAARGLDIPEVGIVVQYEPPVDPHTFIHRIGRTARMGKNGVSVVLLTPEEQEYIPFMRLQNVTLLPHDISRDDVDSIDFKKVDKRRTLESAAEEPRKKFNKKKKSKVRLRSVEALQAELKKRRGEVTGSLCESESILKLRRAVRELPQLLSLATRAFVSFIRAYKEHECRYIFQLKKIDITALIHSFALFKVPNAGELRKMSIMTIPLQSEFDDVVEKLNEEKLKRKREEKEAASKAREEAEACDDEEDLMNPSKRTRVERNKQFEEIRNNSTLSRKAKSEAWRQAEIDEIMRDSYYIKKEKQGRISKRVVDEISGIEAMENAGMSTRERKFNRKLKRNK